MDRGEGATTKQMLEAPQGSIFLWCNGHTDYPKALARHLGRQDLNVKPLSWAESYNLNGRVNHLVVDHAAWGMMSDRQMDLVRIFKAKG